MAPRAWWAGTSLSLAIWPKIATRRLAICSPTDARPVCDETVALLTVAFHVMRYINPRFTLHYITKSRYFLLLNGVFYVKYCHSVFSCSCPLGFEGPRCQQTKITFIDNSGYVVLKPLESCETDKVSFEFMTTTSTGSQMLFYTGPLSGSDSSAPKDFMAVQLVSGYPQLRLNLGDGEVTIPASPPSVSLSNGNYHSVEVFRRGKVSCARCLFFACA